MEKKTAVGNVVVVLLFEMNEIHSKLSGNKNLVLKKKKKTTTSLDVRPGESHAHTVRFRLRRCFCRRSDDGVGGGVVSSWWWRWCWRCALCFFTMNCSEIESSPTLASAGCMVSAGVGGLAHRHITHAHTHTHCLQKPPEVVRAFVYTVFTYACAFLREWPTFHFLVYLVLPSVFVLIRQILSFLKIYSVRLCVCVMAQCDDLFECDCERKRGEKKEIYHKLVRLSDWKVEERVVGKENEKVFRKTRKS